MTDERVQKLIQQMLKAPMGKTAEAIEEGLRTAWREGMLIGYNTGVDKFASAIREKLK